MVKPEGPPPTPLLAESDETMLNEPKIVLPLSTVAVNWFLSTPPPSLAFRMVMVVEYPSEWLLNNVIIVFKYVSMSAWGGGAALGSDQPTPYCAMVRDKAALALDAITNPATATSAAAFKSFVLFIISWFGVCVNFSLSQYETA